MKTVASNNTGTFLKHLGLAMDRQGCRFTNDVSYMANLNRHRQVVIIDEKKPQTEGAWMAQNATVVGAVLLSKYVTLWYGVTIRAEMNAVRIGHFSSIGDGTSISSLHSMPDSVVDSVNIGKNVRVGSNCVINSCIIDDDVVIGDNCVIREGAKIERGAVVLANSVVLPGRLIPAGQVWGGSPATFVRKLSEQEMVENYAASYKAGAADFSKFSLFPSELQQEGLKEGEVSIEDYAEKHFFDQFKH